MRREVLDTNVLLRFLVGDNEKQHAQAERWLKEAEIGKKKIVILPIVIAEAVFVLESFYKRSRVEIVRSLLVFISQRWLEVQDRETLSKMWSWYEQGFHFVDTILLAWSQVNEGAVLTFDAGIRQKTQ